MPLIEGISPKRARVLRLAYKLVVVGCALWAVASVASPPAVATFVAVNLLGLAIFDNRLVRRPVALGRRIDGPFLLTGYIVASVMATTSPEDAAQLNSSQ